MGAPALEFSTEDVFEKAPQLGGAKIHFDCTTKQPLSGNGSPLSDTGTKSQRAVPSLPQWLALSAILAGSFALRIVLAVRGGQFLGSDESRYAPSRVAISQFFKGHLREGIESLFSSADHLLFKVIGLAPALLEYAIGESSVIPAIFFGAASVVMIFLVWRLVLQEKGTSSEALFAALLMAQCTTFVYYARHIYPYDAALCFMIVALMRGLRPGLANHFLAGLFAGLGFLTYNGYWQTGGALLVVAAFAHRRSVRTFVLYVVLGLLGLIIPIVVVLLVGWAVGHNLLNSFVEFSGTTPKADIGHLWKGYLRYLWSAEHGFTVLWLVAIVVATVAWVSGNLEARGKLWLSAIAVLVLFIVVPSDIAKLIAHMARHVRAVVIFSSVLGGWFLAKLFERKSPIRFLAVALPCLGFAQFVYNIQKPLKQEFPPQFEARAQEIIREEMRRVDGTYRILNARFLDSPNSIEDLPHCVVVASSPHFLQFEPYLYDAWNADFREQFLRRDISMKVVRILPEAQGSLPPVSRSQGVWAPYTGPVRLEMILNADRPNTAEPLISSGVSGNGDMVYETVLGNGLVQIGFDHWGSKGALSRPIKCDLKKPHVIVISMGSLYPATGAMAFRQNREYAVLKHAVLVTFDGVVVICEKAEPNPASPESITLFHNLIGFSTSVPEFSGRILSESPATPAAIVQALLQAR